MAFKEIRELLLPEAAERNEMFRQDVFRESHVGLKLVGAAEIAYPVLLFLSWFFLGADWPGRSAVGWQAAASVSLGAATLGTARLERAYQHSRTLAWLFCWLLAVALIGCSLMLAPVSRATDYFVLIHITLVMLLAVAAVPLQPLQTLTLGLSIGLFYLFCSAYADLPESVRRDGFTLWFILTVTLLSTLLTAVLYAQRSLKYQASLQLMRSFQDLRRMQLRVMLTENAAALGRLAAAVSHELNSPLGALRCSVDTLLAVAARQTTAPPSEQQRLQAVQAELRCSVLEALGRLEQLVGRIQRFTNLDRAEVQSVDLNDLLRDVAALLEPQAKEKVHLELDLEPLRSLSCRPQQLSAVFSSLLVNAIAAVPQNGSVSISTRQRNSQVEVQIQDAGRGVPPDELGRIFEPSFRVSGGHVSTGNWSLFHCRRIIRQHRGELKITSEEGRGATVRVMLPCDPGSFGTSTWVG